jgi:hypothetical protein
MNFMGVFNFNAPYLPWAFLAFGVLMNNEVPTADLMGMAVGHVYYFLQDIYPRLPGSRGIKWMSTPRWLRRLAGDRMEEEEIDVPVPAAPAAHIAPVQAAEPAPEAEPVESDNAEQPAAALPPPPAAAGPGGYAWSNSTGRSMGGEPAKNVKAPDPTALAPPAMDAQDAAAMRDLRLRRLVHGAARSAAGSATSGGGNDGNDEEGA